MITKDKNLQPKNKEQAFSTINAKAFITVVLILTAILLISGTLSYFIPQGSYVRDQAGNIIMGTYSETRDDHVKSDNIPVAIMEKLVSGELICVKVTPNVEAFYFVKPHDWPDNWAELGSKNKNKK